jgi:hypothetical protein
LRIGCCERYLDLREEVIGGRKNLYIEELIGFFRSSHIVRVTKDNEVSRVCFIQRLAEK